MARGALDELLSLADAARAANDLVSRSSSLGRACAEAEARLVGLREQEATASRKLGEARAEAHRLLDEVKTDAQVARDACERACQRREAEAEVRCAWFVEKTEADCAALDARRDAAALRVAELVDHEADLGQKVAALRAALADLRSKLA